MDIIILCETPKRQSYEISGMQFHKEYAIADNMTNEEREYFSKNYGMREIYGLINPVISMRRRVNTLLSGEIQNLEWDYFDIFKTRESASSGLGDSDYWQNGISRSKRYDDAIYKYNLEKKLNKELAELDYQVNNNGLKDKYNAIYDEELKNKGLYRKAKKGNAPQEIIEEIRAKIKPLYSEELETINNRINEIKAELTA